MQKTSSRSFATGFPWRADETRVLLVLKAGSGSEGEKGGEGSPAPLAVARERDRFSLMEGVTTFNLHAHLPHLERLGDSAAKLEVLARQTIDMSAPPHPFTSGGRRDFDALLQSAPGVFRGRLLVCDTTTFSSTVGGLDSLQRFWRNVVMGS